MAIVDREKHAKPSLWIISATYKHQTYLLVNASRSRSCDQERMSKLLASMGRTLCDHLPFVAITFTRDPTTRRHRPFFLEVNLAMKLMHRPALLFTLLTGVLTSVSRINPRGPCPDVRLLLRCAL